MSKAAEDRIFGSYIFINYANKGKLEKINQVLTEYRKTAKDIAIYLWDIFFVLKSFLIGDLSIILCLITKSPVEYL